MGHLINPIQFRLGHSAFYDRNWPALNKEQYMFCYSIQKDFTDYFKAIFILKKKLVLKRRNRKRKLFTKAKHPRLLFSNCNVNFFSFNLNRVLVDVNLFDLRFEAKWDSLFDNRRFQKFLFRFGKVFRTAKILRKPTFFINIKKETIKKFFIILNNQYNKVNGTLISQTTKWVKTYLSKVYQKFFSFFTDSAYLVNKRKALRQAKQYIKKRPAKKHVFIPLKYKKRQKRFFLKNWNKIFLLLSPFTAKINVKLFNAKNKKKIAKIRQVLLNKNKKLLNFSDIFDIYFRVVTHRFAKKVRRRDLNRFYKLVEANKTNDYLKSIKKDLKYSLSRLALKKPILSLIPLEDKFRLYKAQAHYYLKNIILKKQELPVEKYINLIPAFDLDKRIMKKFLRLRVKFTSVEDKVNKQMLSNETSNRNTFLIGLNRFISNTNIIFFLIKKYDIITRSAIRRFKKPQFLFPYIIFPKTLNKKWFKNFFKNLILEFTLYRKNKNIVNKKFLRIIQYSFYKKMYIFKKRVYQEDIITKTRFRRVNRIIKKYPSFEFTLLKNFKLNSSVYKNILKNWIINEGNIWLERIISKIVIASSSRGIRKQVLHCKKLLLKPEFKGKIRMRYGNNRKTILEGFFRTLIPYAYPKKDLIWNSILNRHRYIENKVLLFNKIHNHNYSAVHKELLHTLDHSEEREDFLRGSSLPIPKYQSHDKTEELPAFDTNRFYKHFESPTMLANIDPMVSEKRSIRDYHYTLDPFFQKYMKLKHIKSLLVNIAIDVGDQKMITAKFLTHWLKSLFKKGKKLTYVLKTLDRFVRPCNNYIGAVSVLFAGRFTRSAYTTNKYYRFGRLNSGEILKQMDYDVIEFTTKFGMCGIKVKMQYKVNIFATRDLANYLKTSVIGSEPTTYKFNENLHLPMLVKYGSKRLFRVQSNLKYKNNIPFYQFK